MRHLSSLSGLCVLVGERVLLSGIYDDEKQVLRAYYSTYSAHTNLLLLFFYCCTVELKNHPFAHEDFGNPPPGLVFPRPANTHTHHRVYL